MHNSLLWLQDHSRSFCYQRFRQVLIESPLYPYHCGILRHSSSILGWRTQPLSLSRVLEHFQPMTFFSFTTSRAPFFPVPTTAVLDSCHLNFCDVISGRCYLPPFVTSLSHTVTHTLTQCQVVCSGVLHSFSVGLIIEIREYWNIWFHYWNIVLKYLRKGHSAGAICFLHILTHVKNVAIYSQCQLYYVNILDICQ